MPVHATGWRIATVLLIFALAWGALNPAHVPPQVFVLGSHFLLGFVCTAAFPKRAWIGILVAIVVAIGLELTQSVVPFRDVRGIEVLGKWVATLVGVALELCLMLLRQSRDRREK
ncbi:hypothetical protein [Devosia beringensis]|uniref:hypothetical protein n=1 Tax=Devosia beringensis TaxID=2657486 RepID=UPI00186B6540|nr:hypothetical protein [Devosia beringensis]